jgi:protoheme IX farnesyltransferase
MALMAQPQKKSISMLNTLRVYRDLMKIRIVILLVFTTVTAMVVAADGIPPFHLLLPTIIAGVFAAGGSSAMNQYLDRDMDGKMKRTSQRPIPSGRVEPINALLFGLALIAWSVLILGVFVNWFAATLTFIGAVYYVWLYTLILKRNTAINIVIGGGAGAIPVLVGWTAVTGSLSIEAWLLFAIVFYWTPPHSWALAILVNRDYAAAGVPMMPVARGEDTTRLQILLYSVQLVAITLIPAIGLLIGADVLGVFYLLSAVLLGAGLIYMAVWLLREPTKALARAMYKYSSTYLALLFLAMIIDRILVNLF